MPVLWLQYCLLYYVSTLVLFFGDLNHVIVCRQRPESDCFVILAAHVISTQHQRATLSLTDLPPLAGRTQRGSVSRETKVSVLCRHIFNSQNKSWKWKKGRKQTPFVFTKTRHHLLLRSGLWCHRHGSPSLWPLGWWFSNSPIKRCTPIRALILFYCHAHASSHKRKHACIHLISQK